MSSPAAAPRALRLVVTLKGREIGRFDFSGNEVHIGRHPDNEVQIDSLAVSRFHCVLRREATSWLVEDLGSNNGTFLNGARIERHEVRPGDSLGLGRFEIALQAGPDAEAPGGGARGLSLSALLGTTARELRAREKGRLTAADGSSPPWLLERDMFQIGAAPQADLRLAGPLKRALLVRGYGGFQLVNVAPEAGELSVDGTPVDDRAWLEDGARLRIGSLELVFQRIVGDAESTVEMTAPLLE